MKDEVEQLKRRVDELERDKQLLLNLVRSLTPLQFGSLQSG